MYANCPPQNSPFWASNWVAHPDFQGAGEDTLRFRGEDAYAVRLCIRRAS